MGLTEIELKTGSYNSVTETNNGTGNITRVTSNEEVTASSSFSSTSPYHIPMQKNASNLYYAVVKTGVNSTKFNSEEGPNQWAAEYSATVFLSGYISHHDAYSKRAGSTTYSGSFSYSGTFLTFTALFSGTYTIECWGASGGDASYYSGDLAGRGGYVSGQIDLDMDDTFYIYVALQRVACHGGRGQQLRVQRVSRAEAVQGSNGSDHLLCAGGPHAVQRVVPVERLPRCEIHDMQPQLRHAQQRVGREQQRVQATGKGRRPHLNSCSLPLTAGFRRGAADRLGRILPERQTVWPRLSL